MNLFNAALLLLGVTSVQSIEGQGRTGNICKKRRTIAKRELKGKNELLEKVREAKGWPNLNKELKDDEIDALCAFNKLLPPNQGCWALYDSSDEAADDPFASSTNYFGCPTQTDGSCPEKVAYEALDEFCECLTAYDYGCIGKIPHGEPNPIGGSNLDGKLNGFFFSQVVTGPNTTPENYGDFCEFGLVLNGDADIEDAHLSEDADTCGCLWVDAVEELIDNCFGNERGDFDVK